MATLRDKRKAAAFAREAQEEHQRNGQSRNMSVPKINEQYITQVIRGDLRQGDQKTVPEIQQDRAGALFKLDEFLLNPHLRTHSGTVLGTSRNINVENQ